MEKNQKKDSKIWEIIAELAFIISSVRLGFFLEKNVSYNLITFLGTLCILVMAISYKIYFAKRKK
jgi:hypothetical protein